MVKRRQQERLYTDDEYNYLRCDIKQDKDIIKGTLFFDKYMKVAKVCIKVWASNGVSNKKH